MNIKYVSMHVLIMILLNILGYRQCGSKLVPVYITGRDVFGLQVKFVK